jgi:hypothetical protein
MKFGAIAIGTKVKIIASKPKDGQCGIEELIGKEATFIARNDDGSIQVSIRGYSQSPCVLQRDEWQATRKQKKRTAKQLLFAEYAATHSAKDATTLWNNFIKNIWHNPNRTKIEKTL